MAGTPAAFLGLPPRSLGLLGRDGTGPAAFLGLPPLFGFAGQGWHGRLRDLRLDWRCRGGLGIELSESTNRAINVQPSVQRPIGPKV